VNAPTPPSPPPSPPPSATKSPLETLVKQFQIFGVVISLITGAWTVEKAWVDITLSTNKDAKELTDKVVDFYRGSADKAVALGSDGHDTRHALFLSSFRMMVNEPAPRFSDLWFNHDSVQRGLSRICQARTYAIQTYYNVAAAELQPSLQAAETASQKKAAGDFITKCTEQRQLDIADSNSQARSAPVNDPSPLPPASMTAPEQSSLLVPGLTAKDRRGMVNQKLPDLAHGWQVDSYYCGAVDGPDFQRAQRIAWALRDKADGGQPVGGEILGLIRLRPITPKGVKANTVVYDPGEESFARALAALASEGTTSYGLTPNGDTPIAWYVSMYSCSSGQG